MSLSKLTNTIKDGSLGASSGSNSGAFAVVGVSALFPAGIVGVSDPLTIMDTFGDGALRDFLEGAFSTGRPTAYCRAIEGTTPGTVSAVTSVKVGVGTVSVSGLPRNAYGVAVEILETGGLNSAIFRTVIDGVASKRYTVPANPGAFVIPDTGLTITFAGAGEDAFKAGDVHSFSSTEPTASNAEILAAIDELLAAKLSISAIYIAGVSSSALWAAFDAKLKAEEAKNNFLFGYCQVRYMNANENKTQWVDALATAERGAVVSVRVGVVAGWMEESDTLNGQVDLRGFLGKYAGLLATIGVQKNPDDVGLGALSGVTDIKPAGLSDADLDRLVTAGYVVLRRFNEVKGIFVASGRLLSETTSDFKTIANRRVLDEACRRVCEQQIKFLNSDVGLGADGSPEGLLSFKAQSEQPLKDMKNEGKISGYQFVVPDGQNILSSERITTTVRVIPRGKMSYIDNTVSFYNPAIEG